MQNKKLRNRDSDETVEVEYYVAHKIKMFQKPVPNWDKFDKLLMTANNGKPIVGDIYYDWKGFVKKYPEYKDAVDVMALCGGMNTVYEFSCLRDGNRRLTRGAVLLNLGYWEEIDE